LKGPEKTERCLRRRAVDAVVRTKRLKEIREGDIFPSVDILDDPEWAT
jgi:hypothetical protein